MINVEIDSKSGFCFGVVYAITKAEEYLDKEKKLLCLGDIVHNNEEVKRLEDKGLQTIDYVQLSELKNTKVLIRAHGEPPETYKIALKNNIQLIDASCPVVLKLQSKIKNGFDQIEKENGQLIIFGKKGHAEVNGLVGQTNGKAIVISSIEELDSIDFTRPISLFSQTTKSLKDFNLITEEIKKRIGDKEINFIENDTICRQVANRDKELHNFCTNKDVIIFVSGKKSSNGKVLFDTCKLYNEKSFLISELSDLKQEWFQNINSVGICGATSTPMWLMEDVKKYIENL